MVQIDYKPLKTILYQPLAAAPLILQAVILKSSGDDLKEDYLPGKKQVLADSIPQPPKSR